MERERERETSYYIADISRDGSEVGYTYRSHLSPGLLLPPSAILFPRPIVLFFSLLLAVTRPPSLFNSSSSSSFFLPVFFLPPRTSPLQVPHSIHTRRQVPPTLKASALFRAAPAVLFLVRLPSIIPSTSSAPPIQYYTVVLFIDDCSGLVCSCLSIGCVTLAHRSVFALFIAIYSFNSPLRYTTFSCVANGICAIPAGHKPPEFLCKQRGWLLWEFTRVFFPPHARQGIIIKEGNLLFPISAEKWKKRLLVCVARRVRVNTSNGRCLLSLAPILLF